MGGGCDAVYCGSGGGFPRGSVACVCCMRSSGYTWVVRIGQRGCNGLLSRVRTVDNLSIEEETGRESGRINGFSRFQLFCTCSGRMGSVFELEGPEFGQGLGLGCASEFGLLSESSGACSKEGGGWDRGMRVGREGAVGIGKFMSVGDGKGQDTREK